LGGPRHNNLTRRALEELGDTIGATQHETSIIAGDTTFDGSIEGDVVREDFGLAIRTANPFCRDRTLIIISGSHTYGVTAAARFLVESSYFTKRSGTVAVVVCSQIEGGHALEPKIMWESNV
jgi:hypothetical protein